MIVIVLMGCCISLMLGGFGYALYNDSGGYREKLVRSHSRKYMYSFKMNDILHDTVVSALSIVINDQSDKIPTSRIMFGGRNSIMIPQADSSYLTVVFGNVCDKTSLIRTVTVSDVRFVLSEKQSQSITKLYGTLQVMYLVKNQGAV